ncbi:YitT family protein [Acidaminobacter sp. JC074]|uniref:YitT family protein n=1 Tax=Acidaminobacter sp. JC074 TaxID=2530199 RepID=UPI001F0EB882|nr:YitT family protein [Acidaminobacter sp. JC074]MCH4886682.1 YitT family protein [Acidaminobacter sp. JC074]
MKIIKDYLIVTLGTLILTFGLCVFLIPADLAVGGITGFSMIINRVFPGLSIGGVMMISNVVLFIMGFLLIGRQFGAKTIYASFSLSGMIWLFEKLAPLNGPVVEDTFLNLFFGIFIGGIGLAIVFNQNASTGGTDIIAKIINRFFNFDIGKSLLMADFLIVLFAMKIYGLQPGLYAMFGVIMNAFLIDNLIEGMNNKINVRIISSKTEDIRKYIINELDRGATIFKAEGAYAGKEVTIISTVLNRRQFIKIKAYVKAIDDNAFLTVANVKEVIGEGFKSE